MFPRRVFLLIIGLGVSCCVTMLLLKSGSASIIEPSLSAPPEDTTAAPETIISVYESIPAADITLPAAVNGTSLSIEKLISYDGPFMEDGSNHEVANIAAVLLHNSGNKGVIQAEVVLERGALTLHFDVTAIPPGESVLVLERDRKTCKQGNFTACYGWSVQGDEEWHAGGTILLQDMGDDSLCVINITQRPLANICLYYKTEYANGLFYIGGITYKTYIGHLEPGMSVQIRPEHYAAGYSRVVRIQAENITGP